MKKSIMSRLGAVLLITVLMAMCLSGCGGGTDTTGAIKDAAEGLMSALKVGDMDKISEYSAEDMLKDGGDLSELNSITGFTDSMLSEMGVDRADASEEAIASIEAVKDVLMSEFITDYTINDVQEEDGIGYVSCDVTYGYNVDAIDDADVTDEVQTLAGDYTNEHIDELMAIYNEQGQDALTYAIVNGILPDMMTVLKDKILASEGDSSSCILKIENIDGKWLVTEAKLTEKE